MLFELEDSAPSQNDPIRMKLKKMKTYSQPGSNFLSLCMRKPTI